VALWHPAPVKKSSPYSIDRNLLGRSIEAGGDVGTEPWKISLDKSDKPTPRDEPEYVEIDSRRHPYHSIVACSSPASQQLNQLVGTGFGRIDMVENRLVASSAEIYEAPALLVLTKPIAT